MSKIENSDELINIQHSSSSLWSTYQPNVQRRINALLNYQLEYFNLRVEFYRQLQSLQYEYNSEFEQIFEKRRKIINGSIESIELETKIDTQKKIFEPDLIQSNVKEHERVSVNNTSKDDLNVQSNLIHKGLPNFWLTVLKNIDSYDYPIQLRDELCLKYLSDIRCILSKPNNDETSSFALEFYFLPSNPFFHENILKKTYFIRIGLDQSSPYRSYDGPEVDRCEGCLITWKTNQNLTKRKRNRRIRNKITGEIRFEQIEEQVKSFFDFFSPPIIPSNGIQDMNDEDQMRLEADIEFGLMLKQRVLPRAILYYTGEILPAFNEQFNDDELTSSDNSQ